MLYCELHPSLFAIWSAIVGFLNSAFISAFLSALAGAGLGVWAAQRIAERAAKRSELLSALKQANALIVLAYTVANNTLGLKKQYVLELSDTYAVDRAAAQTAIERIANGEAIDLPPAHADMTKITPHSLPLDALKNLMFSGNVMPGKVLALATMIDQSAAELSHVITLRNELIDDFKASDAPAHIRWHDFFGIKRPDGNTNALYADAMRAIRLYTDDLIFYSSELSAELGAFAKLVKGKLDAEKVECPKAASVDFSDAEAKGLMPDRAEYESWLSGVQVANDAS
ncbi:hypothetical protein [Lysobacter sp. HA18]